MIYLSILAVLFFVTLIDIDMVNQTYGEQSNFDQNITVNQTYIEDQTSSIQNITTHDQKKITITTYEFNKLLNTIKESIILIEDDESDIATSKLGLAIIEILNTTQQYNELVKFASSYYEDKIQLQINNDDQE